MVPLRNPPSGERRQQAFALAGALPIDMKTIAELARLDVADKTIDLRDGFGGRRRRGEAKVLLDARGLRLGTDRSRPAGRGEPGSRPSAVEYSSSNCSSRSKP